MAELNISIMGGDFETANTQLINCVEEPIERLAYIMTTTHYNGKPAEDLNGADAVELAAFLESFSAQAERIRSSAAALQRYLDHEEVKRRKEERGDYDPDGDPFQPLYSDPGED